MDVIESPPLPLQPVQQRDPYLRLKQQQKQLEMLSIQVCGRENPHKLSPALLAVPLAALTAHPLLTPHPPTLTPPSILWPIEGGLPS